MTIPIQLAIQGGGAKITHLLAALEAVQSLQRRGIVRVTRIAGTSAGAIAGALLAGVDMQRARDVFEAHRDQLLRAFPPTTARFRAAWCLLTQRPFWDAAPLRRVLVKLLAPRERLGDLAIPLVIVAADLTNMRPCVYDQPHEPLISSLMDPAGIPYVLRTPPGRGREAYRIVVDGGVCENLPSDQLAYSPEQGEVVGITFSTSRDGTPLCGLLDFARALLETALNTSVLRAQLALGPNNFVIRTEAGSFDFARAFSAGLGAEYRETCLLAEEFFRDYASRTAAPSAPPGRWPTGRPRRSRPRACRTSSQRCGPGTACQRRVVERVVNAFETANADGDYATISIYNDGPHDIRQITYGRSRTTASSARCCARPARTRSCARCRTSSSSAGTTCRRCNGRGSRG